MKTRNITLSAGLLLALAATARTSVSGQDLFRPPAQVRPVPGESLWYDQFPSAAGEKKGDSVLSCSPCPQVYGYIEGLFLHRTNGSFRQPVIVDLSDGSTILSTSDLNFGFDPAARVVAGCRLHDGWALEGAYFGLFDARSSKFLEAPDESSIYTFPEHLESNVFADMNRIWVGHSSSLHSGELNLVCCQGWCDSYGKGKDDLKDPHSVWGDHCGTFEWFVGFRYLNFRERLNIYAERDEVGGVETGVYNISTSNNLYGPQFGARVRRWRDKWGWEAAAKAGIVANDAQQEQYILEFPDEPAPFPLRPLTSDAKARVAFVGELNLTGIYRLNDVWNLRGGYNAMWVSGVALAPDQLDFGSEVPASIQISSSGNVFLHGVSCGIEARW